MTQARNITALLIDWNQGDAAAGEALMPLVYAELYKRSSRLFQSERPDHTLQPTALINEAYARLMDADISYNDRLHFFAMASRMMRRVLIDHAKARHAQKRGGDQLRVTYDEASVTGAGLEPELLDLVEALQHLEQDNPRLSECVDLHYFAGLSVNEIHAVTSRSVATIGRDLRFARAWLSDTLSPKTDN